MLDPSKKPYIEFLDMFRGKSMITDCKQMRKLLFFLAVTSNMQSFKLSNNSTRTCQESSSKNFFGHIKRLTKTGDFEKMLALVFKVKGKYLDQNKTSLS